MYIFAEALFFFFYYIEYTDIQTTK